MGMVHALESQVALYLALKSNGIRAPGSGRTHVTTPPEINCPPSISKSTSRESHPAPAPAVTSFLRPSSDWGSASCQGPVEPLVYRPLASHRHVSDRRQSTSSHRTSAPQFREQWRPFDLNPTDALTHATDPPRICPRMAPHRHLVGPAVARAHRVEHRRRADGQAQARFRPQH